MSGMCILDVLKVPGSFGTNIEYDCLEPIKVCNVAFGAEGFSSRIGLRFGRFVKTQLNH